MPFDPKQKLDLSAYDAALRRERVALGLSAPLNLSIDFDPQKHPRDLRGKFRKAVGGLAEGQQINLPDGTNIAKVGGKFHVDAPRDDEDDSPKESVLDSDDSDEAADRALTESAKFTAPESVGGETAFEDFDDAEGLIMDEANNAATAKGENASTLREAIEEYAQGFDNAADFEDAYAEDGEAMFESMAEETGGTIGVDEDEGTITIDYPDGSKIREKPGDIDRVIEAVGPDGEVIDGFPLSGLFDGEESEDDGTPEDGLAWIENEIHEAGEYDEAWETAQAEIQEAVKDEELTTKAEVVAAWKVATSAGPDPVKPAATPHGAPAEDLETVRDIIDRAEESSEHADVEEGEPITTALDVLENEMDLFDGVDTYSGGGEGLKHVPEGGDLYALPGGTVFDGRNLYLPDDSTILDADDGFKPVKKPAEHGGYHDGRGYDPEENKARYREEGRIGGGDDEKAWADYSTPEEAEADVTDWFEKEMTAVSEAFGTKPEADSEDNDPTAFDDDGYKDEMKRYVKDAGIFALHALFNGDPPPPGWVPFSERGFGGIQLPNGKRVGVSKDGTVTTKDS